MATPVSTRPLLRALHVTILIGALGLVAACGPTGLPAAGGATTTTAGTPDPTLAATAAPVTTTPITTTPVTSTTGVADPTSTITTTPVIATPATTGTTTTSVTTVPTTTVPTTTVPTTTTPVTTTTTVPVGTGTTTTVPVGTGFGGTSIEAQAARAVFDATNTARSQAGVSALVWNDALQRSAHQHNLAMAAVNELSHQLPGETGLGVRISAQGVQWTSVGENIGYTTDQTRAGALSLHTAMINETPPDDGHRRSKLNPNFTALGVDVFLDPGTGRLWLTEDYARS